MLLKKKTLFLGLVLMGASYADCQKNYTGMFCDGTSVDNITASGNVVLQGTTVTNKVAVSGLLDAYSATLNEVGIAGKAQVSACKIASKFAIKGYLEANDSNFAGSLDITANEAKLTNVNAQNINVFPDSGKPSKLVLAGTTNVTGNISFNPAGGEVVASSGVTIKGKITGAKLTKTGEQYGC